jgi:NADPH-dependent glutamate synthase beta subunit-like oxidoreductase/CO/xanthine dehydrogenase FAD-binding subunit
MQYFNHTDVEGFDEASQILETAEEGKKVVIAGGTDLLGVLRERILKEYPEEVVNLKTIPASAYVKAENGTVKVGALTKLKDIVASDVVQKHIPMLAKAAATVATPLIRNVATIGGNICQDVRCWFYRYPHEVGGRLDCSRKGGDQCYAILGDNRYHSIFGGMTTHAAPCTQSCPAGTDIPGYMAKLREGDINAAAEIVLQVNPMPMVTSRVCAHFCQEKCNREQTDEHVATGNVERSIGDYILQNAAKFYAPPEAAAATNKTVAIIGSGPAGLTAAFYLRKAGHRVTVYDKMEEAGGQLTFAIPAYRLPKHYVRDLVSALEKMGIQFVLKTNVGTDITLEEIERRFDSVFFDTGAWKRPILGFDGEHLTQFGLDFLIEVKKWMKGKIGRHVLVTGGGNVAMDVAITAKRLGAASVTMACLESESEMPASKEEIARAREEGVKILPSFGISRVVYEGDKVKGMELVRCTSVFDAEHHFAPVYDQHEKVVIDADSILMAVGQRVDLSFLGEKYELQLKRGLIEVEEGTQRTSRPGVFAGGDVTSGPSTVVKAVKAGGTAARAINEYLGVKVAAPHGACAGCATHFLKVHPEGLRKTTASKLPERPAAERGVDIEDTFSLDWKETLEEAKRCLNCGCYSVNASDISPVLVALNATIRTTKKTLSAKDFFTTTLKATDNLAPGELVVEIIVPIPKGGTMHYDKFRLRDSVDFAIVSLASVYKTSGSTIQSASLVFGGVAPVPYKAATVEAFLEGKEADVETAEAAAELAVRDAICLEKNAYKIQELKTLVKRSILAL